MAEMTGSAHADRLKRRASLVGAAINVLQTAIKLVFGILGQSAALIADGIHSLSDLLSDLLVIIAVRLGSRAPDRDHPYGHRRFETIATVILGISLIGIGAAIIWHLLERVEHPETLPVPQPNTLGIAAVSILLNEWLYHYTKRIAKTTRSKLLLANAWHQRSDALSSLVVLCGIIGVLQGYPYADAIAAAVVALMVAKIGLNLVSDSIKELVDTSLPVALVAQIRAAILEMDGVQDIHLLRTRRMGEDAYIDAHIVVDPRITVSEGHSISDAVRDALISRFDDVTDVLVHVDAEDDHLFMSEEKPLSRAAVQRLLDGYLTDLYKGELDFRIHYLKGQIELEIILPLEVLGGRQMERAAMLAKQCQLLQADIPQLDKVTLFLKYDNGDVKNVPPTKTRIIMAVGQNGQCDFPDMPAVAGISLGTACAGIKQNIKDDVLLMAMPAKATCAAVFTQNAFCAAPVQVAKAHLAHAPRWLLINSGNANAGTGEQGLQDALASCAAVAKIAGGDSGQVLPFSTGVIGQPLPITKITAALPAVWANLAENQWLQAARAIMTTDTFPKGVSKVLMLAGQTVTINGIAKGAGMIHPNMATLLAFVATDAHISQTLLQTCLTAAVGQSFNRITVDGDTSTNDACVLMASGCSAAPEIVEGSEHYRLFAEAVMQVCKQLAELIVRDGEGATKLIRIAVTEAASVEEALLVAKTIAHSPLVKTAFFASDANWGRILAAVGRAGVANMVLDDVQIFLDDVCIVKNGGRASDYTEEAGQAVMSQEEIAVTVKLGRGALSGEVLTCDFSYDYVKINAEYRT